MADEPQPSGEPSQPTDLIGRWLAHHERQTDDQAAGPDSAGPVPAARTEPAAPVAQVAQVAPVAQVARVAHPAPPTSSGSSATAARGSTLGDGIVPPSSFGTRRPTGPVSEMDREPPPGWEPVLLRSVRKKHEKNERARHAAPPTQDGPGRLARLRARVLDEPAEPVTPPVDADSVVAPPAPLAAPPTPPVLAPTVPPVAAAPAPPAPARHVAAPAPAPAATASKPAPRSIEDAIAAAVAASAPATAARARSRHTRPEREVRREPLADVVAEPQPIAAEVSRHDSVVPQPAVPVEPQPEPEPIADGVGQPQPIAAEVSRHDSVVPQPAVPVEPQPEPERLADGVAQPQPIAAEVSRHDSVVPQPAVPVEPQSEPVAAEVSRHDSVVPQPAVPVEPEPVAVVEPEPVAVVEPEAGPGVGPSLTARPASAPGRRSRRPRREPRPPRAEAAPVRSPRPSRPGHLGGSGAGDAARDLVAGNRARARETRDRTATGVPPPAPAREVATAAASAARAAAASAGIAVLETSTAPAAAQGRDDVPGIYAFKPRRGARRVLTLAMVAGIGLSAYLVHGAVGVQDGVHVGLAAIAVISTAMVWAIRAGGTLTRLTVRSGQLEVVRQGGRYLFDLASEHTVVEVHGRPGRRGWRVVFPRRGMSPFVVDRSMVDPRDFTRVLEHYRPG